MTQFYINFSRQEHQIDVLYVSFKTWDSQVSAYILIHFFVTVPLSFETITLKLNFHMKYTIFTYSNTVFFAKSWKVMFAKNIFKHRAREITLKWPFHDFVYTLYLILKSSYIRLCREKSLYMKLYILKCKLTICQYRFYVWLKWKWCSCNEWTTTAYTYNSG